jgi:hypothetical protein
MSEIDLVPLSRPDKPGYLAARIGDRVGDLYVEHRVARTGRPARQRAPEHGEGICQCVCIRNGLHGRETETQPSQSRVRPGLHQAAINAAPGTPLHSTASGPDDAGLRPAARVAPKPGGRPEAMMMVPMP